MLTLPDPKHEAFATLRASGHDLASAYVHAGYSVKNIKSRSRKLVRNPAIQARIAHLKTCLPRIAELHDHHCPTLLLMPETRHEMLVWLWQVMNGTRLIKPAQMRAATLYSRLQGWHLAKLLPQAQQQAQAGSSPHTTDAADKPPVPSSTLTESEKTFLASSNRENIAHERTLMPRSSENLARYQSILANLALPACRQDSFGRPLANLSESTPATTPAPTSSPLQPAIAESHPTISPSPSVLSVPSVLSARFPNPLPSADSTPSNDPSIPPSPFAPPVNPAHPVILSKNPHPNPNHKPQTINPLPLPNPQPRLFLNSPSRSSSPLPFPPRKIPRPCISSTR